jgi:general secretion pathway protein J
MIEPVTIQPKMKRPKKNNGVKNRAVTSNQTGFTLIEVMVALFIFALLASAALALLTVSVDSENVAREKSDQQAMLRRFSTILRQDLAHSLARPSRDDRGNFKSAFYAQDDVIMGFVRGGIQRLDELGGYDVRRIEYRYADGVLRRFVYSHVDGSNAGQETVLFDNIEQISMRYRLETGLWQDEWRDQRLTAQPIAIEMVIERSAEPPLRLVMALGRAYNL